MEEGQFGKKSEFMMDSLNQENSRPINKSKGMILAISKIVILLLISLHLLLGSSTNFVECRHDQTISLERRFLASVAPSTTLDKCTHQTSMSSDSTRRGKCSAINNEYGCQEESNCPAPLTARKLIKKNWGCWDGGSLTVIPLETGLTLD